MAKFESLLKSLPILGSYAHIVSFGPVKEAINSLRFIEHSRDLKYHLKDLPGLITIAGSRGTGKTFLIYTLISIGKDDEYSHVIISRGDLTNVKMGSTSLEDIISNAIKEKVNVTKASWDEILEELIEKEHKLMIIIDDIDELGPRISDLPDIIRKLIDRRDQHNYFKLSLVITARRAFVNDIIDKLPDYIKFEIKVTPIVSERRRMTEINLEYYPILSYKLRLAKLYSYDPRIKWVEEAFKYFELYQYLSNLRLDDLNENNIENFRNNIKEKYLELRSKDLYSIYNDISQEKLDLVKDKIVEYSVSNLVVLDNINTALSLKEEIKTKNVWEVEEILRQIEDPSYEVLARASTTATVKMSISNIYEDYFLKSDTRINFVKGYALALKTFLKELGNEIKFLNSDERVYLPIDDNKKILVDGVIALSSAKLILYILRPNSSRRKIREIVNKLIKINEDQKIILFASRNQAYFIPSISEPRKMYVTYLDSPEMFPEPILYLAMIIEAGEKCESLEKEKMRDALKDELYFVMSRILYIDYGENTIKDLLQIIS